MKKSKNLVSLLVLVLISFGVAHQSLANDQTIDNTNSYLGLNSIEKPKAEAEETKQKIKNERSFLNINLIKVTCECEDKNKD